MAAVFWLLTLLSICSASNLPIVDLGYALHQANTFQSPTGLYNFSNIRYAAPPLGDLRFRAPEKPEQDRRQVQNGSIGRVCPQGFPIWSQDIEPDFLLSQLTNTTFNKSTDISSYPYVPYPVDPRTTEDCLFLDVIVPQKIFDRSRREHWPKKQSLAPVLVWIFGGGFAQGDKTTFDPAGLVERSTVVGDGVVYVTLNYRLGAFGWLAGDTLTQNGTANAGLHDQRLALDWVAENIHLFGGDPTRVTVMGESSGGGSIMHHITAYGGEAGPSSPFQQAIVQSPGWVPVVDDKQSDQVLKQFLGILNVSTVEQARNLPSEKLMAGNAYQIATKAPWGSFIYGPVVDGTFVPALPGQLLQQGKYDHDLNLMTGYNANEGLVFTSPDSRNSSWLAQYLKTTFPHIKPDIVEYITQELYPPVYDGSHGYTDSIQRTSTLNADMIFKCSIDYLNRAYNNRTFAYEFSVPPAIHGQDVLYTYYSNGTVPHNNDITVTNVTVSQVMQDYFTSFAQFGRPKSPLGPVFEQYGSRQQLMNIGNNTIRTTTDTVGNSHCRFWQPAPYL
ncbi:hypothetical protein N7492_009650 [Penicillium capsulatum]|uniref:Carboxylic ester hydrolase n=1 Tax=Penicillium capsulatum TaxID=69766 RepID=A0A9W9HUR7_9EURO|nr:hypothetical protein N7492_009650 [Penicillium capsulatum]KAJ6107036.1 hypothetical protein N7512_010553 [Penicillium capsulatum]